MIVITNCEPITLILDNEAVKVRFTGDFEEETEYALGSQEAAYNAWLCASQVLALAMRTK